MPSDSFGSSRFSASADAVSVPETWQSPQPRPPASHDPPSTTKIAPGDPLAGRTGEERDQVADVLRLAPPSRAVSRGPRTRPWRARSGAPPGGVNAFFTPSVGIGPGATALTVIRSPAHSSASVRVSASTPGLGRRGVRHERPAAVVQGHRDRDDAAAALRLHHRVDRLAAVEGAVEIGLDHRAPGVGRQRRGRRVEVAGGVVHQEVDPAVLPGDPLHHARDRLGLAHVGLDRRHRGALRPQRVRRRRRGAPASGSRWRRSRPRPRGRRRCRGRSRCRRR